MSAIILTKPASGKVEIAKHTAGTTYKIDFPVADVRVLRADDGVSLEFPDAARIVLAGYTPEEGEAEFEADGKMLDAEKFLTTLDENLPEPAMGPENQQTPPKPADDGGHYNEYDVSALLTGIDHLWGLDIGFDSAVPEDRIRLADPAPHSGQKEYAQAYSAIPAPNGPAAPETPQTPETRPAPPVATDPVVPQPEPVRPQPGPAVPNPAPKPIVPEPDDPVRPEPSDPVPPSPIIPDPVDPVVPGPDNPENPGPVLPEPTKPEASNIPVREDGIENGDSVPITIPGYEIVEVVENGGKGTVEKDPETGEWKYTLKEPSDHPDPGQDVLPGGDKVVIKIRDPEGNEYEIEQKFDIVDDTPETSDDHQKVVSGDPEGVGGQIVIDFGADNDPEKTDVKISINGKDYKPGDEIRGDHGVLTITPDGKYEYKADPKGLDDPDASTDEFSVTVKDADGDEAEGKITIDVVKPAGPDPDVVLVDESLLPDGNAKKGVEVPGYTILDVITNGSQGSLTKAGDSWIYTLGQKQDHSAQGKDVKEGADTVTLLVRDANGNEYAVERTINVIDDIPEAAINGGGTVMSGDPAGISGTIDIDWGVDDGASKKLFVSFGGKEKLLNFTYAERYGINSEHGLLVIEKDGTWTYEAKPLAAGQDSAQDGFSIKVIDSDGDIASPETWAEAWLRDNPGKTPDDVPPSPYETKIDIVKPSGPENPENVTVSEKGLPETNPDVPVTPPDGYEIVKVKTPGDNGTLEKDPETGEWKYVLKEPEDHPEPGEDTVKDGDTVVIIVKDPQGNEYEIEQKVDIIDDTPEVGNDHKEVISGDPEGVSGNIAIDFGADNDPDKTEVRIEGKKPGEEIRGEHGVIVVNEDGSYTYKADPKGIDDPDTSTDEFTVTVEDADGDEVEGKIVIDVKKPDGPGPDSILVDEALLPDGNAKAGVEIPGYTILGVVTNGSQGTLVQDGDSWIYTLSGKQEHSAQGKDVKEGVDTVTLKVKDANGNEYTVVRTIDVQDDVPEAEIKSDGNEVTAGDPSGISGTIDIDWGVDNTEGKKLFVTVNGVEKEITGQTEIEGAHGKLTVEADGNWTYTANGMDKDSSSLKENISVRVVDSDGDISSSKTWAEAWLKDNPDKTPDDVPPSPYETTIDIVKPAGPDPDIVLVDESLLPDGNAKTGVEVPGYTILDVITNGSQGSLAKEGETWIYTLGQKQDHSAQGKDTRENVDSVTLLVRDANGNEYAVKRIINIIDDIPEASISGDTSVLAGSAISGEIDIDWGVDNDSSKKLFVTINGEEKEISGKTEIEGAHGKLTVDADGQWTYTANGMDRNSSSAKENISVRVVDSDGDIASPETWAEAWLRDNPGKTPDDVPPSPYETVIDITKPEGPENPENVTVSEKGLPETNPDVPVTPPDGYEIVEVKTPGDNGTLEKDPETGEWKYVLKEPEEHSEPGEDTVKDGDTVVIIVKDPQGNEYEIEQKVDIIDDTPEVGNDHKEVISGDPEGVSGNITIDFGADNNPEKTEVRIEGKKPGEEIRGEHGVIVVNEDGSYTYKADPKGIDDPDTSTDEFTVTVKDADGDEVEGKIVIDVKKPDGPGPDSILVDESLLPDGGAKNVVEVPGYTILGIVTNGSQGEIVQDGEQWVYELGQKQDHSSQGKDVKEGVDTVTLKVKDANGNEYLVERTINVIDDVPEASISGGGEVLSGNEISGAITIDWGVDNDASKKLFVTINGEETEISGQTELEGAHGKLTVEANGNWTYVANGGMDRETASLQENISVRVVDSDGDVASPATWAQAWLKDNPDKTPDDVPPSPYETVIDITKPEGPQPAEVSVNEKGLRNDGHPEVVVDIKGYEIVEILKNGDKGVIDTDGKYVLNDNADHLPPNGEELPEGDTVRLVVRDANGNEYIIDQPIKIIDDIPEAKIDAAEKSTISGDPDGVSGKVDIEFGADNDDGKKFVVKVNGKEEEFLPGTEITGEHGKLTIDADGNYKYVSDPKDINDPNGKDVFSFEVTDSDGDTASAELTVNVAKPAVSLDPIDSHEKNMAAGDAINPGEYTILDVIGQGQFGQVEQSGDNWIYKLNDNLEHGQPGSETDEVLKDKDSVTLKVSDKWGNIYEVDVSVNVHDDTPGASLDRDAASVLAGKEFTGKLDYDFGADNDADRKITVEIDGKETEISLDPEKDTVVAGKYGELTVRSDGSYTYKANDGQEGQEEFFFKVTDSDGDVVGVGDDGNATLKVTVDVKDEPPVNPIPPVLPPDHLVVNEKDMADDSAKAGITIVDVDGKEYSIVDVVEDGFFGKVVQEGDSCVYKLDKAAQHDGEGRDTMVNADLVRLKVADEDGNIYIVNRKVDIIDDIPELSVNGGGNVNAGKTITGELSYSFGADNGEGKKFIVSVDGNEIDLIAGQENIIEGLHGTLTINADGKTWFYKANDNDSGKDSFQFIITDSDGDTVNSVAGVDADGNPVDKPIEIFVDVKNPKVPNINPETIYEADLANGSIIVPVEIEEGYEIIDASVNGDKGTISKNSEGKWIYTFDKAIDHDGNEIMPDAISLIVRDVEGNEFSLEKCIDIVNDKPRLALFEIDVPVPENIVVREEDIASGNAVAELDGEGYEILGVVNDGQYGKVSQVDGKWVYTLEHAVDSGSIQGPNRIDGADSVTLKVRDKDGFIREVNVDVDVIDSMPGEHGRFSQVQYIINEPNKIYTGNIFALIDNLEKYDVHHVEFVGHPLLGNNYNFMLHSKFAIAEDGTYTFDTGDRVVPSGSGLNTFIFRVFDSDGDYSDHTIKFIDNVKIRYNNNNIIGTSSGDLINPVSNMSVTDGNIYKWRNYNRCKSFTKK